MRGSGVYLVIGWTVGRSRHLHFHNITSALLHYRAEKMIGMEKPLPPPNQFLFFLMVDRVRAA
jgi:hypothetical protein